MSRQRLKYTSNRLRIGSEPTQAEIRLFDIRADIMEWAKKNRRRNLTGRELRPVIDRWVKDLDRIWSDLGGDGVVNGRDIQKQLQQKIRPTLANAIAKPDSEITFDYLAKYGNPNSSRDRFWRNITDSWEGLPLTVEKGGDRKYRRDMNAPGVEKLFDQEEDDANRPRWYGTSRILGGAGRGPAQVEELAEVVNQNRGAGLTSRPVTFESDQQNKPSSSLPPVSRPSERQTHSTSRVDSSSDISLLIDDIQKDLQQILEFNKGYENDLREIGKGLHGISVNLDSLRESTEKHMGANASVMNVKPEKLINILTPYLSSDDEIDVFPIESHLPGVPRDTYLIYGTNLADPNARPNMGEIQNQVKNILSRKNNGQINKDEQELYVSRYVSMVQMIIDYLNDLRQSGDTTLVSVITNFMHTIIENIDDIAANPACNYCIQVYKDRPVSGDLFAMLKTVQDSLTGLANIFKSQPDIINDSQTIDDIVRWKNGIEEHKKIVNILLNNIFPPQIKYLALLIQRSNTVLPKIANEQNGNSDKIWEVVSKGLSERYGNGKFSNFIDMADNPSVKSIKSMLKSLAIREMFKLRAELGL